MFLVTTTHTLEMVLSAAVATNELHYYVAYADHTGSGLTPGSTSGTSSGTTPVTILSAPGASTQRQVSYISIHNADTAQATLTIRNDDGTNERILVKTTLQPEETLEYSYQYGWQTIMSTGLVKGDTMTHLQGYPVTQVNALQTGGVATGMTLINGFTYAVYMGRATRAYTSADIRYRITTAAVGVTWAEIGIATGPIIQVGQAFNLTTKGFTDISVDVTSTGNKTATVSFSGVTVGDDLWVLLGNSVTTTAASVRATSVAHNLSPSKQGDVSSTRPSTMAAGTTFGISSGNYPWVVASFS